jgi:endonuclease-3
LAIGNRQSAINAMAKKDQKNRGSKSREAASDRKKRARRVLAGLRRLYPDADCALRYHDPLQLLIATILSAQSTDETVNKVTPGLFERFPTPRDFAEAPREEIERLVHSTGFFRQKTKSVQGACRKIVEEFGGKVPATMEQLVTLPGVARKTANVVLGTAFGKNEGIVVDTHVGRLATRLGLTLSSKDSKDAVKIERDLIELFPQKEWTFLGHALIWHGRRVCFARKPNCPGCTLAGHCPSAGTFEDVSKKAR